MEERTGQRKGRRVRHRTRRRWQIGGMLLILLLAIALIGATHGTSPEGTQPNPGKTGHPSVIAVDGVRPENQYSVASKEADTDFTEADTDWYLTLVNRWNSIPENYKVNLVEVAGGEQVDERIYEPLMEMLEAAKEDNWDQLPLVVSGYRTEEKQQQLYNDKIAKYRGQGYSENEAKEMAGQWVAVPGYSEHQLGFAVDINGATYDVYLWLQENSYKFGFIFRYPGNKTEITGTAEEVWHYRYVGVEAATEIHERGICLEEYLEYLDSQN